MKLTTYLHLVPRLKSVELYLHSPYIFMMCYLIKHRTLLNGVVLSHVLSKSVRMLRM